jgi:serine/threonine protein kinase
MGLILSNHLTMTSLPSLQKKEQKKESPATVHVKTLSGVLYMISEAKRRYVLYVVDRNQADLLRCEHVENGMDIRMSLPACPYLVHVEKLASQPGWSPHEVRFVMPYYNMNDMLVFRRLQRKHFKMDYYMLRDRREQGHLFIQLGIWLFYQVLQGLDVMHAHHYMHGDISPENIFIEMHSSTNPFAVRAALGDFGMTCIMSEKYQVTLTHPVGKPVYVDPIILAANRKKSFPVTVDGVKADMFSVGKTMMAYLDGVQCYSDKIHPHQRVFEKRPADSVEHLIVQCLHEDPKKRPTTEEALGHPCFKPVLELVRQQEEASDKQADEADLP